MKKIKLATLTLALAGLSALSIAPAASAVSIEVVPWLAPNGWGSPSFAAAEANAVQAMYLHTSNYGTPGTPSYFHAQSNVTSAEAIVTGFPSWLGRVDPGSVYGPAFASELGNRMHFALRVDGGGSQFSISQLSLSVASTDAPDLNYAWGAGGYNYGTGFRGVMKGTDGLLWTSDDTFVTGGANTQLVDGLVGRGSGNSEAAYCTGCSLADQQAALNAAAAYPGRDFQFTGTYTIGMTSGSGTFNVAAVPEPETYAMMLTGLTMLGFIGRRRKQKVAAA